MRAGLIVTRIPVVAPQSSAAGTGAVPTSGA
jgi:hypothetical protein